MAESYLLPQLTQSQLSDVKGTIPEQAASAALAPNQKSHPTGHDGTGSRLPLTPASLGWCKGKLSETQGIVKSQAHSSRPDKQAPVDEAPPFCPPILGAEK